MTIADVTVKGSSQLVKERENSNIKPWGGD
jgi:hypothetical protein